MEADRPYNFKKELFNAKGFEPEDIAGELGKALDYVSINYLALCDVVGKRKSGDLEKGIVDKILVFESKSKKWRCTIDFPTVVDDYGEKKYKEVVIQFCSGAPEYNRYVLNFYRNEDDPVVDSRVAHHCVDSNPNLSIVGGVDYEQKEKSISLAQAKEFYDAIGMQRIAVLGAARVFPYRESERADWHKGYTSHIQAELDEFMSYMDRRIENEDPGFIYALVNGGWAGTYDDSTGSMGAPLISHLFGTVHSAENEGAYQPITVMPSGGSHDRVVTMADYFSKPGSNVSSAGLESEKYATAIATYFEIEGVWGDDSKYLAAISTSLMVFDPHGLWTDIEIANGVSQGKPVVIIADPKILAEDGYGNLNNDDNDFWERPEDGVRVYKKAVDAAMWISEQWRARLARRIGGKALDLHAGLSSAELNREDRGRRIVEKNRSLNVDNRPTWMKICNRDEDELDDTRDGQGVSPPSQS